MNRSAILRWPQGSSWGHLSVCTGTGKPQFVGFVRMSDQRVQQLLDHTIRAKADSGMWEARFTVPAEETASALMAASP